MFFTPREKKVPLGHYGKLPFYGDFLRGHCFQGAAGMFREWLDTGFDFALRTPGASSSLGSPRWVLFSPKGKTAVVARIRDSSDKNEDRVFPFATFVQIPRRWLPGPASQQVTLLRPVWRQLSELSGRLEDASDVPALDRMAQKAEVLISLRLPEAPSVRNRFLVDGETSPGPELPPARLISKVHEAYAGLRNPEAPKSVGPALRIPLDAGLPPTTQAVAWLRSLEDTHSIQGDPSFSLVLAEDDRQPSDLWIFARPLDRKDFATLATPTRELLCFSPGTRVPTERIASLSPMEPPPLRGASLIPARQ